MIYKMMGEKERGVLTHGDHSCFEGIKVECASLLLIEELKHSLILSDLLLTQEFLCVPPPPM